MADSTESPSGASSSSSAPPSWPLLPVAALRDKIVEKVQQNRVTLIVGETGCGKSSQVPLYLLEENFEPIVCTQPRRFAVVAIARMVAKARNCEVGTEIGYHIGHSNVSDFAKSRSKIVFKTAGVLLEQMRDKGVSALNYKVIILDEVHERSVESDLVLACVKQFMLKNNDLRVVLMSATADIARYKDYFKDLGRGERVEVIAIPGTSQHAIFQRKVLFLEQVAELLGEDSESLSARYCSGLTPSSANAEMKPEVHVLIHKLVLHIHRNEPEIQKSILIFLPTYYSLEQQWIFLKPLTSHFKVHILHRSVDTDQALLAMRTCMSHRKVILATNIAESSVTIPGVAHVIDSCRSLQVFWDSNRKIDSSELVWVSKSQAEQRKGRTGRTCDGQIYRLVTGKFYSDLPKYEYPAILRLSLRQQVLMISCAESKAINDPRVLLPKVMDPPDSEVVEDALRLLVHIHALQKPLSHRGHHEPTFYGRLLDSLPLSFDASTLALKFGEIGWLREGILISILMDIQPLPILQPFGHPILFLKYINKYFADCSLQTGKLETLFMANLCALQFWQRVFKDKHRLERLKRIIKVDGPKISPSLIPKLEEEWCYFHNISQTSLHNIWEIYEDILSTIHCFRPYFFVTNELPSYFEPYKFKHTCFLQSKFAAYADDHSLEDENLVPVAERRVCCALPYVAPNDFQATIVCEKLKTLIKEIKVHYTEVVPPNQDETANDLLSAATDVALCRFFMKGQCNKGDQCSFAHSLQAKKPGCKFFFTLKGCRNGDSCFFSHDFDPSTVSVGGPSACLREERNVSANSFLDLMPTAPNGRVLILNDTSLFFSANLSQHLDPVKIIAITSHPCSSDLDSSLDGCTVKWNVSDPCGSIIETKGENPIPWNDIHCVLLFADIEVDNVKTHHRFLQNFFEFLSIRVLAENLYNLRVIITMNNIRFAQLQVERLARDCFFHLTRSFPFDESTLGKFSFSCGTSRHMQVSATFSYVFDMHPPTDIQFGDYSTVLYKALYCNQQQDN